MDINSELINDLFYGFVGLTASTKETPELLKEVGKIRNGRLVCVAQSDRLEADDCREKLMGKLISALPSLSISEETNISIIGKALKDRMIENRMVTFNKVHSLINEIKAAITENEENSEISIEEAARKKLYQYGKSVYKVISGVYSQQYLIPNLDEKIQDCFSLQTPDKKTKLQDVQKHLEQREKELLVSLQTITGSSYFWENPANPKQKTAKLDELKLTDNQNLLAKKIIKKINFEKNPDIFHALHTFMFFRGYYLGKPLNSLSAEQFENTLKHTLLDLRSRGLGVVSYAPPILGKLEDKFSEISELAFEYEKVVNYDRLMNEYLNNHCNTWPVETYLYRGGSFIGESEKRRNIKKGKDIFNPETVNFGANIFGNGLYLTPEKESAIQYSKRALHASEAVFIKLRLKNNVPLLNLSAYGKKEEIMSFLNISDEERFKHYLHNEFPGSCILKHSNDVYTIKDPSIVAQVKMIKPELAMNYKVSPRHRLDENEHIKGHPTEFKTVSDLPENLEKTGAKASGFWNTETGAAESLDVLKYIAEDEDEDEAYVVKSPISDKQAPVYWEADLFVERPDDSLADDYKVSNHRLDENKAIKGHPTEFKIVPDLPDNLEKTRHKAYGFWNIKTGATESLDVLKYMDKNGKEKYVVQSPISDEQAPVPIYWRAHKDIERPGDFIVEPAPDFLKQRYEEKRKQGISNKTR
ncbi:hypothetical protein [Endozoicomonas sp.]|uniref:hypothetical protein n=1 Tax=Endozoicomonas sp. TaxID=1892382 RepID=UPI00383AC940